jgi:protein-S-isoprenylcysteine O-methyltransferase Ste14
MADEGVYGIVRHPMYGGVTLAALGWSLFALSPLGVLLSMGLFAFFDRKAAQEEIWLAEKYPGYADYKQRVKKLIPFVY